MGITRPLQRIRPISVLKKKKEKEKFYRFCTRIGILFPPIAKKYEKTFSIVQPRSKIKPSMRVGSMTDHAYSLRTVWEVKLWRQRVIDNIERRADHYVWMFEGKQAAINSGVHRGCSSRRGMTSSGRCAQNAPARLSPLPLFPSTSISFSAPSVCLCIYIWIQGIQPESKIYTEIGGERERETDRDRGEKERKGGHCYLQHKPALASVGDIGALVSSVQRGEREGEGETRRRGGGGGGKVDLLRDHRRRWRKRRRRRISGTRAPIGAEERIWQTAKDRDVWMFERQSAEAALELSTPSPLLSFSASRVADPQRCTTIQRVSIVT